MGTNVYPYFSIGDFGYATFGHGASIESNYSMTIGGEAISNASSVEVNDSATDLVPTFSIVLPNTKGAYTSYFSLDENVQVSLDTGSGYVLSLNGYIDSIDSQQFGKIILGGKGYMGKLQAPITNDVYDSKEVSWIITDATSGLGRYLTQYGITTTNVSVTATTLASQKFLGISVFDAVKQLADIVGYDYWVDTSKDLHFAAKSAASSGVNLVYGVDVIKYEYITDYKENYNSITVYGAQVLNKASTGGAATETYVNNAALKGDGTKTVFVLNKRPKALVQVFQDAANPPTTVKYEGKDYAVDYGLGSIAFTIAPPNNDYIFVWYDYELPIIAKKQDSAAIAAYGLKEKVVNDRTILTQSQATDIAVGYLALNSSEKELIRVTVPGKTGAGLSTGKTVNLSIPRAGIEGVDYAIMERRFDLSQGSYKCELVLASSDISSTTFLKYLLGQINQLKAAQVTNTVQDVQQAPETLKLTIAVTAYTRDLGNATTNYSFKLGQARLGARAGTTADPQWRLGDRRTAWV